MINKRENCSQIWNLITFELSGVYCTIASLLQDYTPLSVTDRDEVILRSSSLYVYAHACTRFWFCVRARVFSGGRNRVYSFMCTHMYHVRIVWVRVFMCASEWAHRCVHACSIVHTMCEYAVVCACACMCTHAYICVHMQFCVLFVCVYMYDCAYCAYLWVVVFTASFLLEQLCSDCCMPGGEGGG